MFKNRIHTLLCLCLLIFSALSWSQPPAQAVFDTINKDDMGEVSDQFQELFFEALKQRAIENYDRAIESLFKAEKLTDEKEAIYFELGKNYFDLANYTEAEKYFQQGLKEEPSEKEFLRGLNEVYVKTENYKAAIPVVQQLSETELDYKEDLAELYFLTGKYKQALQALDELNAKKGESENRAALRRKFYKEPKAHNDIEQYLIGEMTQQPENPRNHIDLMLLYEASGELEMAMDRAKRVKKLDPENALVHLVFYQNFLKEEKYAEAVASMKQLINAPEVSNDIKVRVIKEFTKLTQSHPEFTDELLFVLGEESTAGNQSNQQMGEYYLGKNDAKALDYFKKALKETPNNYDLIKTGLRLMIKEKDYTEAGKLAEEKIGIYPTQAILYLYKAQAENALGNFSEAEEYLDMGIDFIVEDNQLQKAFYEAYLITYQGLGSTDKVNQTQEKLNKIK